MHWEKNCIYNVNMDERKVNIGKGAASKRLSPKEAADYLGLAVGTLNNRRAKGQGPAYYKVGKRVTYSVVDLDAFLNECRVEVGA